MSLCDSENIKRIQILSNDLKNCTRDFNFQRFDFYEKVFLYKVLWSPRISLEIIHGRGSKIKYFACEGVFTKKCSQKFRNPTYKTFLGDSSLNSSKMFYTRVRSILRGIGWPESVLYVGIRNLCEIFFIRGFFARRKLSHKLNVLFYSSFSRKLGKIRDIFESKILTWKKW